MEISSHTLIVVVLIISLISLAFAGYLAKYVLGSDTGTPAMREISDAIKEGAEAFLKRQYSTIIMLSLVLAVLMYAVYRFLAGDATLAWQTTVAFLFGAGCSALAGYIGMWISIRSNIRTASAVRTSLDKALRISFRGGAVSGITIVAMSLLGVGILFVLYGGYSESAEVIKRVPFLIVGYGFGASFVALFAQLGGGIYTKAADVGADLVGKVEVGIPEDDPRNPAVIADLVGDNVGDCAGRGADLFESTAAENIGAMILGVALFPHFGIKGILFPLVARAFGLIASMVGIGMVKLKSETEDPMGALNRGYYVTSLLAAVGFYIATYFLLDNNHWLFAAGVIGIATSIAFVFITQYYTEYKYRPVKFIAEASQTGPATNIISGLAIGLECTALPVLAISAALIASYYCGVNGLAQFPDISTNSAGLYGTAIATMGMLGTAAYILAMDTFGPITDNAGGIVEMSKQPEEIRHKTDQLDAVGNTTKALTKGYAIGSAALAAFLLFSAYMDEVTHITGTLFDSVDLAKVQVFVGGLLGAMLIFLFSALAIRAVARAAYYVISDVRAQFKENPGILEGTSKPNYARCVDIVTKGALKEMIPPGILAIGMPIAVGLIFKQFGVGAETIAAFLMVGTIGGILLATFMNNGGGAWDNAKKFVELGSYGGKGSETHKATVVGDTVGDPFKDTAGPSIHVLIKLLATITLVLAPLFI
ncbi:MAG TPA: sodium-translocating pyrophosphatase [Thermodesulfobacteriota bacterium]|nr:sodium-translocating pyrophosphatase [Thermodesulfobacteriota bacterium]